MSRENSLPCRHRGAPPEEIVQLVLNLIRDVSNDTEYLYSRGLTKSDYELALPAAVERLRGSNAAKSADRRGFLVSIFEYLHASNLICSFETPEYGKDTVYRLRTGSCGDIAVIQKGCPDGAHSSVAWTVPDWASETYLWWVCPSLKFEPGEHVAKGVNRLKKKFFSDQTQNLDGIIFHNELCGSDLRPCPKSGHFVEINGVNVPPPCVWVLPDRANGNDFNWNGDVVRQFPRLLLEAFGIDEKRSEYFLGHVGFQTKGEKSRVKIVSRYGEGRTTGFRG